MGRRCVRPCGRSTSRRAACAAGRSATGRSCTSCTRAGTSSSTTNGPPNTCSASRSICHSASARRELSVMDDEELLAAGDADAFALFYRRHAAALLAFLVRRAGGQVELAADVCAETFAAALIGVDRFDPALGPASGWLYGIARHKLADAQRRGVAEARARE